MNDTEAWIAAAIDHLTAAAMKLSERRDPETLLKASRDADRAKALIRQVLDHDPQIASQYREAFMRDLASIL